MLIYIIFCASFLICTKCIDQAFQKRLYCSLGMSKEKDCPVDGSWTTWSYWSNCRGDCGKVGRRMRSRNCTNPSPAYGGAVCIGEDIESEPCQLKGCTMKQYENLISGDSLRYGQLQILHSLHDKFPELIERCVIADCHYQTVQNILQTNATKYWNAVLCVKLNVGCPVRGGWSTWEPWSSCSAVCEVGSRYRHRSCTKPAPTSPEFQCKGNRFEIHTCEGLACATNRDGTWSAWKPWSNCSVSCGVGIKHRERDCLKGSKRMIDAKSMPRHLTNETNSTSFKQGKSADRLHENGIAEREVHLQKGEKVHRDIVAQRPKRVIILGSSCSGPNIEVAECEMKGCSVNGGWSAWEPWASCSAECGLGAQARSRSCSNPPVQGKGTPCEGPFTEVRRCFRRPCTVKTHQVAVFPGDGVLLFSASGRPSRLLLLYVRFHPLSPSGILVMRYEDDCYGLTCDFAKLALEGQYLVFSAQLKGCLGTVISSSKLELNKWHTVLATISGTYVSLRVNDAPQHVTGSFNCVPILPELDHPMRVGERYRGQIQLLIVNYNPVHFIQTKGSTAQKTGAAPYARSNVAYEVADAEEGFRQLSGRELVRVPCPSSLELWQVEVAMRPESTDGLMMLISGEAERDYLLVTLETGHVRLRVRWNATRSEVNSLDEIIPGRWLLMVLHRTDTAISMSINGGEAIAIAAPVSETPGVCKGDILVGDIPVDLKNKIENLESNGSQIENSVVLNSLHGDLSSIAVDGSQLDLSLLPAELENQRQFSSHAASLSEAYEEVVLTKGQKLNLTCFLGQKTGATAIKNQTKKFQALWLRLDEPVVSQQKGTDQRKENRLETFKDFTVTNSEHFSHLTTESYKSRTDIEGFYGCWIQGRGVKKMGRITISFGVTVIDTEMELSSLSVNAIMMMAMTSVLAFIIFICFLVVQMRRDYNDKFGLYQDVRRTFLGQSLSKEDQLEYILRCIRSPEGHTILGSEEAVKCSEQRVLDQMTQLASEHSATDYELLPLPKIPEHKNSVRKSKETDHNSTVMNKPQDTNISNKLINNNKESFTRKESNIPLKSTWSHEMEVRQEPYLLSQQFQSSQPFLPDNLEDNYLEIKGSSLQEPSVTRHSKTITTTHYKKKRILEETDSDAEFSQSYESQVPEQNVYNHSQEFLRDSLPARDSRTTQTHETESLVDYVQSHSKLSQSYPEPFMKDSRHRRTDVQHNDSTEDLQHPNRFYQHPDQDIYDEAHDHSKSCKRKMRFPHQNIKSHKRDVNYNERRSEPIVEVLHSGRHPRHSECHQSHDLQPEMPLHPNTEYPKHRRSDLSLKDVDTYEQHSNQIELSAKDANHNIQRVKPNKLEHDEEGAYPQYQMNLRDSKDFQTLAKISEHHLDVDATAHDLQRGAIIHPQKRYSKEHN